MGKPTGRPTLYSDELGQLLCAEMATGRFMKDICNDPGMPKYATVCLWAGSRPGFIEMYARARRMQVQARIEDAGRKLEKVPVCEIPGPDGNVRVVVDTGAVQLMKAQAEHARWEASKLIRGTKPDATLDYGDKVQQEISGTVQIEVNRAEIVSKLLGTRQNEQTVTSE